FHVTDAAVFVVRQAFDEERDLAGPVGFIEDGVDDGAVFLLAASGFDGSLDIFFGHIHAAGGINCQTKFEIHTRIGTLAGSNGDEPSVFGKDGTTFGIIDAFFVANSSPM
ncbi:MAG: hypothetical protein QG606_222, partial [Patescibacteria group bacterium]|nr:hypothetical protein [Patescibacteria group bacterium]